MRTVSMLSLLSVSAAAPSWPRFSWDTVPVFYHSCNFTGTYTPEAIRVISKFPMVTIEKGQGVQDPADTRPAEDKIVEVLKAVKAVDPNISTIFYYNSVLDWPFYNLHTKFLQRPDLWVRDAKGGVCHTNGDGSFPNHTNMLSFDFAQAAARDLWLSECVNMTRTGFVDGCFSDRATGDPSCTVPNKTAFEEGHVRVHQELQRAIGNGPLIANHAYDMPGVNAVQIEGFMANEASIETLRQCVANGKITEAHAGYGADGDDDHCSKGITNSLAAFLIGAGSRSYYACSRSWKVQVDPVAEAWHPEYDKPLGTPLGEAVKDTAAKTYTRVFVSRHGNTTVTFDYAANVGHIQWAGDPPPGPTPAPSPGGCNAKQATGISGGDITPGGWRPDHLHTDNYTACCEQCRGVQACVAWTWYTDGSRECHLHDSTGTPHSASSRISGQIR
eukprot:Hpha_TRINITY_DN34523_c0_g1::TRINITY_DN34523_c0_g1_i1::g.96465::m.96465